MWANGKEGLMFKKLCGTYEQKRSKNVLKLKESHTFDVVIMGYTEPTKEFEGKTDLDKWPYWVNEPTTWPLNPNHMVAVTKPYYMGWPGAVEFGVWKTMDWNNDLQLVKIGECRGFSDAELEYIKNNKENLLGAVIEVRAQRLENPTIGSIRHPQFNRWRPDKPAYECTWENHIEAGK
jgi:ATP-dependent DNA ligase